MKSLLNDQMPNPDETNHPEQQDDILMALNEKAQELEDKIEKGNLQDYLEIYGEAENR